VHAVRSASPEVRAQLASAAQGLLQAASGLLAAAAQATSDARPDTRPATEPATEPETRPDGGHPRPSSVQRIDLDDDGADEPDEGWDQT
jgi:hypothetical protein